MEGVPGDPGPKNDQKIFFFWKKCFIRSEKARGPAGDRGKKSKKIRKKFDSTNGRPGPVRHRSGTGLARPVKPCYFFSIPKTCFFDLKRKNLCFSSKKAEKSWTRSQKSGPSKNVDSTNSGPAGPAPVRHRPGPAC